MPHLQASQSPVAATRPDINSSTTPAPPLRRARSAGMMFGCALWSQQQHLLPTHERSVCEAHTYRAYIFLIILAVLLLLGYGILPDIERAADTTYADIAADWNAWLPPRGG